VQLESSEPTEDLQQQLSSEQRAYLEIFTTSPSLSTGIIPEPGKRT